MIYLDFYIQFVSHIVQSHFPFPFCVTILTHFFQENGMDRQGIYNRLTLARDSGKPFWGIGVGVASASAAAKAGASWLLVNHTASLGLHMPGTVAALLPFADANGEVLAAGPLVRTDVPVFATAFASDGFRTHAGLVRELKRAGYSAVQNFPSMGLTDGKIKAFLDAAEMGYNREVDFIRLASAEGMFTSALVFTPEQAENMTMAGAGMIVFHPGLNADGEHRSWTNTAGERLREIADAVRRIRPEVLLARSAYGVEEWPPQKTDSGLGIQFDGNFPNEGGKT